MAQLPKDDPTVVFMTGDQGPFRCGHCRFFDRPHKACEKVEGIITIPDCCNLYQPSEAHKEALAASRAPYSIVKRDEVKNIVYGWGNVSVDGNGLVTDRQGDRWDPEELYCSVVDFMENVRASGVMHEGKVQGIVVESFVTMPEIMQAFFGEFLPDEMLERLPIGWMIGVKVSPELMQRVRNGELTAFSIQGNAERVQDGN